mgnify:CR=1 FL=1
MIRRSTRSTLFPYATRTTTTTTAAATPAPVPETVLKRKKLAEKQRRARILKAAAQKKALRAKRISYFKRAEKFVKEYRQQERLVISLKRQAKKTGNLYVEPEAKLAWVVRIRGIRNVAPNVRKALQLLRLRQINNAVFVKLNKASLSMLRLVEPYISWGYPNLKAVRDLIYKRGYAKVKGNRMPITNNKMIETALGKHNIICIEDLVHEIYTVGPNFKYANHFLSPFTMRAPKGGLRMKRRHYIEGGDYGNRETKINRLIVQMN